MILSFSNIFFKKFFIVFYLKFRRASLSWFISHNFITKAFALYIWKFHFFLNKILKKKIVIFKKHK